MSQSPSDLYTLYRASKGELGTFLRAHAEPESEPGKFDKLIEELGRRYEAKYLATLSEYGDWQEIGKNDR